MNDHALHLDGPAEQRALVPLDPGSARLVRDYPYGPPSDLIDLRDIWSALWRNRYLIIAVVAVFMAAGVAVTWLSTPIYRATASVEIDDQPVKVLGTEDTEPPFTSAQEADRFIQTQVDILHSRGLATRVVDSFDLGRNGDFLRAMGSDAAPQNRRSAAIDELMANLQVDIPKNSRVVPISFDSREPNTAAMIANGYAQNLIAANLQRHFDSSTYSRNFLQKQLGITKARLEDSERSLLAYARAAGIVDTSQGAGTPDDPTQNGPRSLTTSNLVQLNQAYAAARSARIQAEQRWKEAQATDVMSLPEVLTNPAIQQLTQKKAELEADYQQQLEHRKPDYPSVKQEAAELKELKSQIASVAGSIKNSIRDQYLTSARQESALAGSVGQLKSATLSEQARGIRYNILKREVDTNRQLYEGLLQRFKEVSAEAGVTANNISVVDLAEPPAAPISPNPVLNLAVAGVAGLAFALLVVLGREMFDDSVRAPDEVERHFGVPILGVVPKLGRRVSVAEAIRDERSSISDPYQAVRACVDLALADGPPPALLVTSSQKAEGKSSTALALARDSAAAGRKVLLVDADMRSPRLHSLLNGTRAPGLAEVLARKLSMERSVQPTDLPNLEFLPSGYPSGSPAHLLSGGRFAALLGQAKEAYDEVIIDSPPVLGLADTLQIAAVVDQTVLVVGCDQAHRGAVKETLRRLMAAHADVLGAVLAKFAPGKLLGRNGYYSYESDAAPEGSWETGDSDSKSDDDAGGEAGLYDHWGDNPVAEPKMLLR